jgi:hypothetical protein
MGDTNSIRMLALQEALADPFQQGNQNVMDSGHLREMNVMDMSASEWTKTRRTFYFRPMPVVSNEAIVGRMVTGRRKEVNKNEDDPDKIFRTYPSFDPVFMKV